MQFDAFDGGGMDAHQEEVTFFSMLAELVQFYATQQRPSVLRLRNSRGAMGLISTLDGEIIHAETARNEGVEAVYEIAAWSSGEVFRRTTERTRKTIEQPMMRLLLDAFWRLPHGFPDEEQDEESPRDSLVTTVDFSSPRPLVSTLGNDAITEVVEDNPGDVIAMRPVDLRDDMQLITARPNEASNGKVFKRLLRFERVSNRMMAIPEVNEFDLFDPAGNSQLGFVSKLPLRMDGLLREAGHPLGCLEQLVRLGDRVMILREIPLMKSFLYAEFLALHLTIADIWELIEDAVERVEPVRRI